MVFSEKLYTAEEFLEFARLPENEGRRLELDAGVIIEMAPSSPKNTVIAGRVIYYLNAYVIPRNLGYVTVPDGGFKLGAKKVRQPDAAFISKTRLPQIPAEFEIAPDLVVEIVSPSEDILMKVHEYLRAGTQVVWAIYGGDQLVYTFRLDEDGDLRGQVFNIEDTLDGGDALPGFTLPVRDIFPN